MSTLFTPEAVHGNGYRPDSPGAVAFQGDAGWGVMTEKRRASLDRAEANRKGRHVLPPVLR